MKEKLTQLIGEAELRGLYERDLLSEEKIATRLGTRQVYIGRLRRRYGIPTITKAERSLRRLPPLTDRQRELIQGSLLGDGWMDATSEASARFQEGHSEAQSSYTEWKADILEPFVAKRSWRKKVDRKTGKVYRGRSFSTSSCPQLRHLYDLFYPGPLRKRVFPSNLPKMMTPFMLAIWYMDDGSINNGRNARIAFGLDDVSLSRGMEALQRLGLRPKVYGEGGNRSIEIMGQTHTFLSLITPHVPDCMRYKLPVETPRQVIDRNARMLTPDKAVALASGGATLQEIASLAGVGVSTVRRRLVDGGMGKRKPGPRRSLSVLAATTLLKDKYPDTSLWKGLDDGTQEEWVQDILSILQRSKFPYPSQPSEGVRDKKMASLRKKPLVLDHSTMGLNLCYPFFPNRYKARYRGKQSAFEAWYEKKALRRAIRWQLREGDPVTPARVLKAVGANARTPTVFRPAVAAYLYKTYCQAGDTVWDPCAGFGGRLVGAYASGVKYIGTDVSPETVDGNKRLAEWLGAKGAEVHLSPAEDFDPPAVQMVMTSPPYFQQEQYTGGKQSWSEYDTFDAWVDGFLRPVVERGAQALTPGGHWVLNIADVAHKGVTYPLVSASRRVLTEAGLVEVGNLEMPISNLNRRVGGEPILVWRKPII